MTSPVREFDGAAARRIRLELGLTAAELATEAGISRSAVTNAETGKFRPRRVVVVAIARVLGVHPDRITVDAPRIAS